MTEFNNIKKSKPEMQPYFQEHIKGIFDGILLNKEPEAMRQQLGF